MLRINVGCGQSPTEGWRNFDNSPSLRISRIPLIPKLLYKFGLVSESQYSFIRFAREHDIEYGDCTKGLPIADRAVDVLYSSHMLEHLDRNEVKTFLAEAFRVLRPGGIIRIAVPDIKLFAKHYMEACDADAFIEGTQLCIPRPRSLRQRLRLLLVGTRHHQWMYDGSSLCRLLGQHGFVRAEVLAMGETRIKGPGALNLRERFTESVFVEAEKP